MEDTLYDSASMREFVGIDPEGYLRADQIMVQGLMLRCHLTVTDEDCTCLDQAIEGWTAVQPNRTSTAH